MIVVLTFEPRFTNSICIRFIFLVDKFEPMHFNYFLVYQQFGYCVSRTWVYVYNMFTIWVNQCEKSTRVLTVTVIAWYYRIGFNEWTFEWRTSVAQTDTLMYITKRLTGVVHRERNFNLIPIEQKFKEKLYISTL